MNTDPLVPRYKQTYEEVSIGTIYFSLSITKSLFTYQEELRVQGVLDGGLYFMTNAISRKKCGGWFRMRAGVLVRGTPLQCIYPSVLIQKYLEKMPAMPSGQIAYMWN